jgi:hypothetical protein
MHDYHFLGYLEVIIERIVKCGFNYNRSINHLCTCGIPIGDRYITFDTSTCIYCCFVTFVLVPVPVQIYLA